MLVGLLGREISPT